MSRRNRTRRQAVAVASALLLTAAACSDGDDGRDDQAGNVTAPPATLDSTTTSSPQDQPDDGSTGGAASLAGTAWLLDRVVEPGGQPVDAGTGPVPAIVTFSEQGVDVYDGVNTVGGEYSLEGDEVRLELGTPSQFPYPGDALPEYELIGHLARLERAEIDGSRLQLTSSDGTRLDFEQAAGGATG
jgi:hypothetical protein